MSQTQTPSDDNSGSGNNGQLDGPTFEATVQKSVLETFVADQRTFLTDGYGNAEAVWELSSDGIEVTAIDKAQVAATQATLAASAFETFEAEGSIGVNLDRLNSVLGFADDDTVATLSVDSMTRKLTITFEEMEWTLALVDTDCIRAATYPDVDLDAEGTVSGADFDRAVTATGLIDANIRLTVSPDAVAVSADDHQEDAELSLDAEEECITPPELADSVEAVDTLYPDDYFEAVRKQIDDDDELTLELGEEMPCRIYREFADGDGQTTFAIAPRIET